MYRYRKTSYRCSDCKSSFDKIRKFPISKYPSGVDLPLPTKDPDCPRCKSVKKVNFKNSVTDDTHKHINPSNAEANFIGGTPDNPAKTFSMGASSRSKAIDMTAEMVMQDYKMTDINMGGNLREGDNCVPKLPHELERKVDQVFKPQKPIMGQPAASTLNNTLMRQINAGAYRNSGGVNDVVARQQKSGMNVPVNIIYEHGRGKPN